MADATGTTSYEYDARDRLKTKATPFGTLTYTYDKLGELKTVRSSNQNGVSVDYGYDQLSRLHAVTDNRLAVNNVTTSSYDDVGNLEGYTYGNGVRHAYTYNSLNRLTDLTVGRLGAAVNSYSYTLGAAGNRESVTESGGRRVAYTYDALYRLKSETVTGDSQGVNGRVDYDYDDVGNRLTRTSTLAGVTPQSSTYDRNDRLTSDTYDGNGNTKRSAGVGYTYDWENRLTEANDGAVQYAYDGDGSRVSKTVAGVTTTYLVDTNNPTGYAQVAEELQGGQVTRQYAYGSDLISERQLIGGQWALSYYGYDGHGSVRSLTDASGAVTDTYTYDAFGTLISRTGTTPNEYLYAGERYDAETGMYHLRARYMDPSMGRFRTMDSYEGSVSNPRSLGKYLYVNDNPVSFTDPSGHFPSPYSQQFGYAVEEEIAKIYRKDHPNNPNVTFGAQAGIGFVENLKPDILNHDLRTFLEIKPLSISGVAKGRAQLLAYQISLGLGAGYEPEERWAPSEHFIYPMGKLTVFFNAEGILFYTDEQEVMEEALTATTITAAAKILSIIGGSGMVSELGQVRTLVNLGVRAGQVQLEGEVMAAEVQGGWL